MQRLGEVKEERRREYRERARSQFRECYRRWVFESLGHMRHWPLALACTAIVFMAGPVTRTVATKRGGFRAAALVTLHVVRKRIVQRSSAP